MLPVQLLPRPATLETSQCTAANMLFFSDEECMQIDKVIGIKVASNIP